MTVYIYSGLQVSVEVLMSIEIISTYFGIIKQWARIHRKCGLWQLEISVLDLDLTSLFICNIKQLIKQNYICTNTMIQNKPMKQRTIFKSNHYKVQDGKLVLQSQPVQKSLNYRYIPYTPLNKPTSEDYYKSTISGLLTQLQSNKNQQEQQINTQNSSISSSENNRLSEELNKSIHQNLYLNNQLNQQKLLNSKLNTQLYKKQQENYCLTTKVNQLGKQLGYLRKKITISEKQVKRIDFILEQCGEDFMERIQKVQKLITYGLEIQEKQEELNQLLSQQDYINENQEQFYSVGDQSFSSDDQKYQTPRIKTQHSAQQIQSKYYTPNSVKSIGEINGNKKYHKTPDTQSNENKSSCGSQLSQNLKNYISWSGNNKISSLEFLDQECDPIAGSLSFFSRN